MPQIQVFQCPSCGANLSYDGGPEISFDCQFCGTTVVVPEELRPTAAPQGEPEPYPQASAVVTPDLAGQVPVDKLAELKQLAQSGQTVKAVKLYRELFDTSLTQAHEAVSKLAAGQPLIVLSTPVDVSNAQAPETDAQLAEVARLARAGQQIEAVKLMRQLNPGMQLKDALEAVKAMGGQATQATVRRGSRATGAGCSLGCVAMVVAVVGFVFAMVYLPLRLSGSYGQAVAAAQSSGEVIQAMGHPIEVEWWWPTMGRISCSFSSCSANYDIPIHGSQKSGHIWVTSDSKGAGFFNEGIWTLDAMVVVNNGASIRLTPAPASAPTLSALESDATQGAMARSTRVAQTTEDAKAVATQIAREAETATALVAEAAATATAEAEAKATAQAVIAAQVDWPVVLSDTFANNRLGWPVGAVEGAINITTTVVAKSYVWEAIVGDLGYSRGFPLKSRPLRDFAASVKVKIIQGDENGWNFFGLVFRHAGEEDGFFGINRNGEWWVKLRYPSSVPEEPAGFGDDSAAIHSGLGQINQITVRALGDDLIFVVNDQVVTHLNLALPAGDVGLGAEWDGTSRLPVKVQFSDLEVRAPK